MIWDSGKKHLNQIQPTTLMKGFPTLQRAWCSIIPGSNIKGPISGVRKNLLTPYYRDHFSDLCKKMQLVSGVARQV